MSSSNVINKWNVNMSVLDDVQLRFSSGEYKTEINLYAYLLVKAETTNVKIYLDEDACYKNYYFDQLESTQFVSAIQEKSVILPSLNSDIETYIHSFRQKLLQEQDVINFLKKIRREIYQNNTKCSIKKEYLLKHSDLINHYLLRKQNLIQFVDIDDYIKKQKEQYDASVYGFIFWYGNNMPQVFVDKRNSNVVKEREKKIIEGYRVSDLILILKNKTLLLNDYKKILKENLPLLKKQWNIVLDESSINLPSSTLFKNINEENIFLYCTSQKYKSYFKI